MNTVVSGRLGEANGIPFSPGLYPEALDPLGQLGEQHLVALHEGRADCCSPGSRRSRSIEPVLSHRSRSPARSAPAALDSPRSAALTPPALVPGEHVHRDGDIEAIQEPPVEIAYLRIPVRGRRWPPPGNRPGRGGRPGPGGGPGAGLSTGGGPGPGGRLGPSPGGGCGPRPVSGGAVLPAEGGPDGLIQHRARVALRRTARLLEQVDFPCHPAHPDRQTHSAGHGHGEPYVLGGVRIGGALGLGEPGLG